MTIGLCKQCSYDDCVFTFCEDCRSRNRPKEPKKQYDEFYRDCKSEMQIFSALVPLGHSGMNPPNLNELGYDSSIFFKGRSDIAAPEFFNKQIARLKKFELQPKQKKHMLSALRSPQHALASWEFNQTFEVPYGDIMEKASRPKFKEEYDMAVVEQILGLIPKIKKITRIE